MRAEENSLETLQQAADEYQTSKLLREAYLNTNQSKVTVAP